MALPATVQWLTSNGSAAAGLDYQFPLGGPLVFAPGQTQKTILVNVIRERLVEADEVFQVKLTSVSESLFGKSVGTGTIINDDLGGIIVTAPSSPTTTELGGKCTFTVKLAAKPAVNVVIPIASSDTTEGIVSKSSLTFTTLNWDTPQTVTVTGVADQIVDGDQPFSINIGPSQSALPAYTGLTAPAIALTNLDAVVEPDEPSVTLSLSAVVTDQQFSDDGFPYNDYKVFNVTHTGTASGPVGTELHHVPQAGDNFTVTGWTGVLPGGIRFRAPGDPPTAQFSYDYQTNMIWLVDLPYAYDAGIEVFAPAVSNPAHRLARALASITLQ